MARKEGKDRGVVLKEGKWWVRLFVNGREKWYRAENKTQAKVLYGRIKGDIREGKYFPEKFGQPKDITLRAWIIRYLAQQSVDINPVPIAATDAKRVQIKIYLP